MVPSASASASSAPEASLRYLDSWPVAHVWLGWALLARPRYTYVLVLVVAVLEIGIVVTKFVLFLDEP